MKKGFSLIETLVVVGLFALVGIIVSQSTATSLTGSRKADASIKVRENLNQALSVMERQIRSAQSITSTCAAGGTTSENISYVDQSGNSAGFSCNPNPNCTTTSTTAVSSTSAVSTDRITSTDTLCITACQFVCTRVNSNLPPTVDIILEGRSKEATGVEDTAIRVQTSVNLRAY